MFHLQTNRSCNTLQKVDPESENHRRLAAMNNKLDAVEQEVSKMSAVEKDIPSMQVTSCKASEQPWVACNENVQAKVLSVDAARHSVEFMFKIAAGFKSGMHRHTCETSVLILEGRLKNHTTGVEFGPGDFCYQPFDDEHVEEFLEETTVFGSYRGTKDTLVEFFDEDDNVTEEFKVSDFAAMLPQ